MQIQKLDTIIMNICILINIYSIYLLYKEVLNVKLQLDDIASKLDAPKTMETPITEIITPEKERITQKCEVIDPKPEKEESKD